MTATGKTNDTVYVTYQKILYFYTFAMYAYTVVHTRLIPSAFHRIFYLGPIIYIYYVWHGNTLYTITVHLYCSCSYLHTFWIGQKFIIIITSRRHVYATIINRTPAELADDFSRFSESFRIRKVGGNYNVLVAVFEKNSETLTR